MSGKENNARIDALISAFAKDGYSVNKTKDVIIHENKIGIVATHSARIGSTGYPKKAYYIEGPPHTLGYLMGQLAEPIISRMCTEFNRNVLLDFINVHLPEELNGILGTILDDIANLLADSIHQDVPQQYKEELEGILDGCKAVNPNTKVNRDDLWIMNVGFDALLAFVYTFKLPIKKIFPIELKHEYFKIPLMCNAFSVFGSDAGGKPYHYLGRDFMFPTGGVFQDTATMIIYKPDEGIPFVSVSAPGIIGAITAMNVSGLAVGVNMAPSGNCDSNRPGLNSLLLNRHTIQNGRSYDDGIGIMANAQRGVSWIYVLADGTNDKAGVVEAGVSCKKIDYLSYPPDILSCGILKPVKELLDNPSALFYQGMMVRNAGFNYNQAYNTQFNPSLIKDFKDNFLMYGYINCDQYNYTYEAKDFDSDGLIDKNWKDNNCPMSHYFAPLRNIPQNLIVATNHFLIPEMRLCGMDPASSFMAQGHLDDIQWRYDELSRRLKQTLKDNSMTYDKAQELIDFLSPDKDFPDYYNKDKKPLDNVPVQGAVSILDLKNKIIKSRYGYYSDQWIGISLDNYIKNQPMDRRKYAYL